HPRNVTLHLVARIKPLLLDQAGSQTQRHRGIIRPLPCLKMKRSPAHHVRHRRKAAPRTKLDGCSHRVAARQPHQAPAKTVAQIQCHPVHPLATPYPANVSTNRASVFTTCPNVETRATSYP